jgi:hypothetical protein
MSKRLPHGTIVKQCPADGAWPLLDEMKHAVVSDHLKSQFSSEKIELPDLEVVRTGSKLGVVQERCLCQQFVLAINVSGTGNAEEAPDILEGVATLRPALPTHGRGSEALSCFLSDG